MPNRSFRVLSAPEAFLAVRVEAGSRPGIARPKGLALTRLEPGHAEGMGGVGRRPKAARPAPLPRGERGESRGAAPLWARPRYAAAQGLK